jgi:hypothetical protein
VKFKKHAVLPSSLEELTREVVAMSHKSRGSADFMLVALPRSAYECRDVR